MQILSGLVRYTVSAVQFYRRIIDNTAHCLYFLYDGCCAGFALLYFTAFAYSEGASHKSHLQVGPHHLLRDRAPPALVRHIQELRASDMLPHALRQILPPALQMQLSVSAAVQQVIPSALLLPSVSQQWASQIQQSCFVSTKAQKHPSRHERNKANHRFCQQRAAWKRQLKELRKQWWQEHLERVAAHRAGVDLAKQQVAQLKQLREASKQKDKEQHKLEREIREAERAVEVAGMRLASAIREELRQATLSKFKEDRRARLLDDSRDWIPPEAFQERIAAALDNPKPLGADV